MPLKPSFVPLKPSFVPNPLNSRFLWIKLSSTKGDRRQIDNSVDRNKNYRRSPPMAAD